MQYHAKVTYGNRSHAWFDASKDEIVHDLLIPFINGQVVTIHKGEQPWLLNMKSVATLKVYKTDEPFGQGKPGLAPKAMFEPDFEKCDCTEELIQELKLTSADIRSSSLLEKSFAPPRKQVFVIMKIGDRFLDSAYQGVMKPLIEELGYSALRIDEVQDSGNITDQVLESIAESQFILADLSGQRPNCYYETGFSHALGKQLILTIRKEDTIHFDLVGYRFITWETEADLRQALKKRLSSLLGS
jgi:hypothetical protein